MHRTSSAPFLPDDFECQCYDCRLERVSYTSFKPLIAAHGAQSCPPRIDFIGGHTSLSLLRRHLKIDPNTSNRKNSFTINEVASQLSTPDPSVIPGEKALQLLSHSTNRLHWPSRRRASKQLLADQEHNTVHDGVSLKCPITSLQPASHLGLHPRHVDQILLPSSRAPLDRVFVDVSSHKEELPPMFNTQQTIDTEDKYPNIIARIESPQIAADSRDGSMCVSDENSTTVPNQNCRRRQRKIIKT